MIRDYQDEVQELSGRIREVIVRLENTVQDLNEAIRRIGEQQVNILLTFETGE